MFRRRRDTTLHGGRVVDLSAGRFRRRSRGWLRIPSSLRLPRSWLDAGDRRNALIWAVIWGVLLLPASADFVNGYATDGHGCRVIGVVDGDTVGLHCPGEFGIVDGRVLGFDTPEIFSPRCLSETVRGFVAKWDLRLALWRANTIGVSRRGHDQYGRELVLVTVDGRDLATRMIAAGLARPYGGGRRQGWCA